MAEIHESIDETFIRDYECERLTETRGVAAAHYYYPSASTEGGRDGMIVAVRPHCGDGWIGSFAFGQMEPRALSGIFTTPNAERICVVSKGEGYLVSTGAPTQWELIRTTPIIDVRSFGAEGIIVFASFTELVGYGRSGLAWDGLKITGVTGSIIKGEFWDVRNEAIGEFTVDVASGASQGGLESD